VGAGESMEKAWPSPLSSECSDWLAVSRSLCGLGSLRVTDHQNFLCREGLPTMKVKPCDQQERQMVKDG
jgi:hypothetical protein